MSDSWTSIFSNKSTIDLISFHPTCCVMSSAVLGDIEVGIHHLTKYEI